VESDSLTATHTERGEAVVVLQPTELAFHLMRSDRFSGYAPGGSRSARPVPSPRLRPAPAGRRGSSDSVRHPHPLRCLSDDSHDHGLGRDTAMRMHDDDVDAAEALAGGSAWLDDDGEPTTVPTSFEPRPVRPFFASRFLYRTRGPRRWMRARQLTKPCRPRGTSRMNRARRVARTSGSRGDPPPDESDPPAVASLRRAA
jgi:hypothetical protein